MHIYIYYTRPPWSRCLGVGFVWEYPVFDTVVVAMPLAMVGYRYKVGYMVGYNGNAGYRTYCLI